MAVLLAEQTDREEWATWRRQGLGGSDASAVVGLNPWKSPYSLWLDKTGQLADTRETEPMRWGSLLETAITDEFSRRYGAPVVQRQHRAIHPDHSWMRCTVDGIVAEQDGTYSLFEAKTANAFSDAWEDGVPPYYALQCAHNMAVLGLQTAHVAVLIGGNDFRTFTIPADPNVTEMLIELEGIFWRSVIERRPPPTDGSDATTEALKAVYTEPNREAVNLPRQALEFIRARESAKADIKAAELRCAEAENWLKAALGKAEIGLVDGRQVVTWKALQSRRVDLDGLRKAHPELVEQFTGVSASRRFDLPKGRP